MKLLRSKVWSVVDIACLKWSCIFSGMIVGGFFPEFTRRNIWCLGIAVVLLAIKPVISYFKDGEDEHENVKEGPRWQA